MTIAPSGEGREGFRMSDRWEIIVVGAGHAGIEAALASARLGHRTLRIPRAGTGGVLACGDPEEEHAPDPEGEELP